MTKRSTMIFGTLALTALAGLYAWDASTESVEAYEYTERPNRCLLAGTWITDPANADVINRVIAIPLDPLNQRISIIANIPQQDPAYGGWFPTVTRITDYAGEAVRTGLDTFNVTLVGHAINGNNLAFPAQVGLERVATAVLRGEIKLIGCETLQSEVWASVYAPDQDPFGDEPPAYGCLGPFYNTRQRVEPGSEPCGS